VSVLEDGLNRACESGTPTPEDPGEIVAINREFHPSRIFRAYGAGGASRRREKGDGHK
jgi:hypothetical protein